MENSAVINLPELPPLYVPSTLCTAPDGKTFYIQWFKTSVATRTEIAYRHLIQDYDSLSDDRRETMREVIDEMLYRGECDQLGDYLKTKAVGEYSVLETTIPRDFIYDPAVGRVTTSNRSAIRTVYRRSYLGFINLTALPDYDLPFQVWGWYNLLQSGVTLEVTRMAVLFSPAPPRRSFWQYHFERLFCFFLGFIAC